VIAHDYGVCECPKRHSVLREETDRQELIATLGDGQYFEEMALLSNRTRNATIRARIETNVLISSKPSFTDTAPGFPSAIYRNDSVVGKNTHRCFSRWAKEGAWQRVFEHPAADADNEYAMIDTP
jgi:CRP-like cAMP-binding protein